MRLARALIPVCLLLWNGWVWAGEFLIQDVRIDRPGDYYLIDMQVDYRMSQTALEALSNGVPLVVEVQLLVEKVRGGFWQKRPLELRLRRQIRYHALTGLYRVVDMQSGEEKSFVTQDAALLALGDLQGLRLVAKHDLSPGEKYQVRLRAELDIESLPLPLRPLAYLNKGWKLSSEWSQWPLEP